MPTTLGKTRDLWPSSGLSDLDIRSKVRHIASFLRE
jgi:hypothetical protein